MTEGRCLWETERVVEGQTTDPVSPESDLHEAEGLKRSNLRYKSILLLLMYAIQVKYFSEKN